MTKEFLRVIIKAAAVALVLIIEFLSIFGIKTTLLVFVEKSHKNGYTTGQWQIQTH